jgi:hypothetical protein
MARKLLFLLPVALFAVMVIAFAVGLRHDPHLVPSALIDRPAPDFALPGLYESANGLSRNDLDGRVTLVNFFASATVRPRSILGFTVCRRLMSWTPPGTSVIAMSVH